MAGEREPTEEADEPSEPEELPEEGDEPSEPEELPEEAGEAVPGARSEGEESAADASGDDANDPTGGESSAEAGDAEAGDDAGVEPDDAEAASGDGIPGSEADESPGAPDEVDGAAGADEPTADEADDVTADAPVEDESTESDPEPAPMRSPLGAARTGPEEDREMPLADHIEEMLKRLAVVVAVAGLVTLLTFPFAERIINFLWYSILPGVESDIARPRLYGVLELVFTELKVASLAGVIVGLPVLVYETYAFMRPGLYPHERRYYLAAIPTSLVLALVGVSFAYFVVLPAIFTYFLYYSQDVAAIGFALGRTFDLILLLMGYLAIVFQIPLFIMLAMMMGLTSRRWLADRRLLFWGAFLGVSFLFSPDPTGMAPIMVAATMIVLFEGTLLLTKWTGRE